MDNQSGGVETNVSLPGASKAEPTILEVLNRNTIQSETQRLASESVNLVDAENQNQASATIDVVINSNPIETTNSPKQETDDQVEKNILEIESHLIETFENLSVSEVSDANSVTINEVPPAKEELAKSSRTDSETSPKTIIEIEPSVPIVLQPIELELDLDFKKLEPQFGISTQNTTAAPADPVDVANTEDLQPATSNNCDKSLSVEVEDQQIPKTELTTNSTPHIEESSQEVPTVSHPVSDSVNSPVIQRGINGLPNCTTPSEEEEKRKLLDSLPQLDETDSNTLSIQAKKEYYQLLRDYLNKQEEDRPPVPLKTYRWEDLRRAKEKGGYPWTYLYKRPLGPDEEPEIVLLLRKSQELRFVSESPRSLKKVRIHDQVSIKETERYINDLSDTEEDNNHSLNTSPDELSPNEDSKSGLSESADASSCVSDSLIKKSKLQKLKGILKRRSNSSVDANTKKPVKLHPNNTTSEDSQSLKSESAGSCLSQSVSEGKKSTKFSKFKKIVLPGNFRTKKEKEIQSRKIEERTSSGASVLTESESEKPHSDSAVSQLAESVAEGFKIKFDQFRGIFKAPPPDTTENIELPLKVEEQLNSPTTDSDSTNTGNTKTLHSTKVEVLIETKSVSESEISPEGPPKTASALQKLKGIVKRDTGAKSKKSYSPDELKAASSTTEISSNSFTDTVSINSESIISDSTASEHKQTPSKLKKLQGIVKRPKLRSKAQQNSQQKSQKSENSPKKSKCCRPIIDKIKTMADNHLKKRPIKTIPLKEHEKICLEEQQKILKLRESPKADRSEIPKFIEKQDSEDVVEIIELDESPSSKRKEHPHPIPDEIIEIPTHTLKVQERQQITDLSTTPEPTVSEILEEELKSSPPQKTLRKMKQHVYEDIDDEHLVGMKIDEILQIASVEALKKSLAAQDQIVIKDMESNKPIPLDRMGSSEEEIEKPVMAHLAPISSIDSASSDEQERRQQLSPVAEESDACSTDDVLLITKDMKKLSESAAATPANQNLLVGKQVVEDDIEPHREDIEVPEELKGIPNRWSEMSDHEYEPIGEPQETTSILKKEPSPAPPVVVTDNATANKDAAATNDVEQAEIKESDNVEDRYFSSSDATTPTITDYEIHTSQVDSSALEELPLKGENRRKGFMASAQDRSRKLKAGIRTQAGKVRTKFRSTKNPPPVTSSPKAREKSRFRAPEFSKMKMPEMPKFKSPELPKFKKPEFKKMEFKRPEFTKFNKPDMSKFKLPEKFTTFKLKRTRSMKEEGDISVQTGASETTPESGPVLSPAKKRFDFSFGTYPRALRRKKIKDSIEEISRAREISTLPSTETPPSQKSATVLRGTRDQGPVGSRWQDKFSDVSFGDSESGRFQRYGSEVESFDRESSMERRMKDDLIAQEDNQINTIGTVEQKQFAEYDEENRAIHEISKTREGEFKQRRPMVHQDSNLSEESKDVGWTDKDALRNKILRRSEMESEGYNNKYASEDGLTGSVNTNQETQSTGSSGAKKGVIEEIDDDEFFLRKRGISQDNIEIRQYISTAIREGFDNPVNSLAQLGNPEDEFSDSMLGLNQDNVDFGYDIPPSKPRRVKHYNNFDRNTESQEYDEEQKENYDDNISLPQTGSDYFQNIAPDRPNRKSKKGYLQDIPFVDNMEKEFYRKEMSLRESQHDNFHQTQQMQQPQAPQAPKRRKKPTRESEDKDSFINGFGGRSVSNSYLQNDNQPEEMIVYRTEHEYVIPLAQPESLTTPATTIRRSRSRTNNEDDDRTSRGADSLASDAINAPDEDNENFNIEMKEYDGYAVVRKEPPPRPPPPTRRKRLLRGKGRFSTLPIKGTPPPARPKRCYSTIGPSRPPRRKTSFGSIDLQRSASDVTQYEELDLEDQMIENSDTQKKLQSGDVIKKMKYRPLPPPPAPPREKKGNKHTDGNQNNRHDKDDHDGGGEKLVGDLQMNGNYDIEKFMDKCIEVEVSTQTDPLPDDFVCEEFEITDDMKIIEPRNSKTLEDLIKEGQDNKLDQTKCSAEESLSKGIQRFREANQRSYSEKSRASSAADRSKSLSRPQTPSAIIIERRIPTPIPNNASETMLQASLTVRPIDDIDLEEELLREEYPTSSSHDNASTVKSVKSHDTAEENEERLKEFIEEERRLIELEEERRLIEEIKEKEEEEERLIMEKIRELQRMEEEEDKRIQEELRDLEIQEQQRRQHHIQIQLENEERKRREEEEQHVMDRIRDLQRLEEEEDKRAQEELRDLEIQEQQRRQHDIQTQQENEDRKRREEEDQKVMDRIRELERQQEEEQQIMDKIRQLEKEFNATNTERSPGPESKIKSEAEAELEIEQSHKLQFTAVIQPDLEIFDSELCGPPNPPPRKRSSSNILQDETSVVPTSDASSLTTVVEQPLPLAEATESSVANLPSHMALADLEVDRLRVHALQAGNIMVSSLHGAKIGADELECKSGNLVVRNLELPPGFIEDIVERVISSERRHIQTNLQPETDENKLQDSHLPSQPTYNNQSNKDDPPQRPPLPQNPVFPSEYMHSIPPAAFFQLRNPDDNDYQPNLQAPRRRRHHRRRDSSSEDESHRHRSRSTRSPEPSVAQLGGQFLQACGSSLLQSMSQVANYVSSNEKSEGGQRNIGTLIAIFILMTLGYILMAMSGKNIHHHHWDYFNPPGNDGRPQ